MLRLIDWFVSLFNPYTVLTHNDIKKLISKGFIVADVEKINATSLDVTLHNEYMLEVVTPYPVAIDLEAKETPSFERFNAADPTNPLTIYPGKFVLGATREIFNLPDNITAVFYMKSSLARCGLDHCNAGFIDPGFNGSRLTLELSNLLSNHTLHLRTGMPIGQIKFYRHKYVQKKFSYRKTGQYNGDIKVQNSKGLR